jgi:5-methylcytosine-specific restriction endonuclease McrA
MYLGDKINPLCVYSLFGWVCGICNEPIDRAVRFPDDMCATLDHIVPLSRGGEHVWANVQPAHKVCNEKKAAELIFNA